MIPTVIFVGLLIGLLARRWAFLAVPILGIGWGLLVITTNDGDFPGAFAYGAANAAVGVGLGAGVSTLAAALHEVVGRRHSAR